MAYRYLDIDNNKTSDCSNNNETSKTPHEKNSQNPLGQVHLEHSLGIFTQARPSSKAFGCHYSNKYILTVKQ